MRGRARNEPGEIGTQARNGTGSVAAPVHLTIDRMPGRGQDGGQLVAEIGVDVGADIRVRPGRIGRQHEMAHCIVPPSIVARLCSQCAEKRAQAVVDRAALALLLQQILPFAGNLDRGRAEQECQADEGCQWGDDPRRGMSRQAFAQMTEQS